MIWLFCLLPVLGISQKVTQVCTTIYGEELMESYVERQLAVEHSSQEQFEMKIKLLHEYVSTHHESLNIDGLVQSLTGEHSHFNQVIKGEKLKLITRAFRYVDMMDTISTAANCQKLDSASMLMQEVSTMITQEWSRVISQIDEYLIKYSVEDPRKPRRPKYLVGTWISAGEQFSDMQLTAEGLVYDLNFKNEPFNPRYWYVKRDQLCFNVVDDVNSNLCLEFKFENGMLFQKLKHDWTVYEKQRESKKR